MAFTMSSYLAGFDKRQVKSTTETSGVGTRKAMLANCGGARLGKVMRNESGGKFGCFTLSLEKKFTDRKYTQLRKYIDFGYEHENTSLKK